MHGSLDERVNDKGAISRFLSDTSANASGSILYLYERMNARRCKMSFLSNTCMLWVGENWKIERGRLQLNLASLSIHGSVKYPVKSHQTLTMTLITAQSAMNSLAETTTSYLSQLTTVLQRDIEGKSYLFSQQSWSIIMLRDLVAITRYETNSLNRKPVRNTE